MDFGQMVLLGYAILMILGGAMGARAGSKVSLYAGLGSGAALLIAFAVTFNRLEVGLWIGCILAAVLTLMFARRFTATRKFMPSGMLLAVSVLAAVLLAMTASRVAG